MADQQLQKFNDSLEKLRKVASQMRFKHFQRIFTEDEGNEIAHAIEEQVTALEMVKEPPEEPEPPAQPEEPKKEGDDPPPVQPGNPHGT